MIEDQRGLHALERRAAQLSARAAVAERRADDEGGGLIHALSQPIQAAMGNLELIVLSGEAPPELHARLERAYEQLDRVRGMLTGTTRGAP
jgi:hypothetical protein